MRAPWLLTVLGSLLATSVSAQAVPSRFEELRRFATEEATQGVAVDEAHFYAIANRQIGKYEKATGRRVAGWVGPARVELTGEVRAVGGRTPATRTRFEILAGQRIWAPPEAAMKIEVSAAASAVVLPDA
jgi:hypothetical protein